MDFKLYDAVIKDDINVFKEMKDTSKIRYQRTPTNNTALHLACQQGSIKCVEEILSKTESSSLLLENNSRGETALHLAARGGHYEGAVALIRAARSLHFEQILIRTTSVELETALHDAVRYNHRHVAELLVTEDPSHSHPRNKFDQTPLYLASIRHYTNVMKTILDNCQSPSFGGPHGRTALHAAVLDDGGRECLKVLLDRNKDLVRVADKYGWTAFHYVAYYNLHTLVEDLVRADASVAYFADKEYQRTALHVAAHKGSVQVMKELIRHFPDTFDISDSTGRNILHIAVEQGQKEVIRFICSQGYKASNNLFIQREKSEGNTPLHLVAKWGCYVKELMNLDALDWEVLNNNGETPLDLLHISDIKPYQILQEPGINQLMIELTLFNAKVKRHMHLREAQQEPDVEIGEWSKEVTKHESVLFIEFNRRLNTQMILAALVATVFLYFMTTIDRHGHILTYSLYVSVMLNVSSVIAMMLAFITGTYAVLAHSSALAISVCAISSLVFLIILLVFTYLIWLNWQMYMFFTIVGLRWLEKRLLKLTSSTGTCSIYFKNMSIRMSKTLTNLVRNK